MKSWLLVYLYFFTIGYNVIEDIVAAGLSLPYDSKAKSEREKERERNIFLH